MFEPKVFYCIVVGTVAVSSWLNADLDLRREQWRLPETSFEERALPSAPQILALSLNYRTFGADLSFISTLIHHGERRRAGARVPQEFLSDALTIAEIDPYFYPIYTFAPGAYVSRRVSLSEDELLTISALMDRGISAFPTDAELPFSAGMNFVGYSGDALPPRRIRELEKGMAYLNLAANRPDPPPGIDGVIRWFHRRTNTLRSSTEVASNTGEVSDLLESVSSPAVEDALSRHRIDREMDLDPCVVSPQFNYVPLPTKQMIGVCNDG